MTTSALYDSTLTTTTDTDTGRHYEYNMSTSRKLRRNTWSAYEGSGTGKGSGWDYLTVTKDGSYSRDVLVINGLTSEADYIMPNSLTYTVTGRIEGSLSDKMDYKYDDKFSLLTSGWATATIGEGTRKITDDYTATEKGNLTQSGSDSHHRISHWDPYLGDLTYTVSVGLDMQNKRQTKTEIVFDWTNDGSTVTEQTKTSNKFYNNSEGKLDAQLLSVSGNVGSGNGTAEASNYHEAYSQKSTQTLKVDASRTMTSWKGGTAFYESYKATDESKTSSSFEQTGHWSSHFRSNSTIDGIHQTGKSDGIGDSDDRNESHSIEKSVTTWQWSFDGQAYGNKVSTLVESWETVATSSSHTDFESNYTGVSWNSSGIIAQNSGSYAVHELDSTNYSQLTETISTDTGFQPEYLMGSVMAVMTITPVTGWNPSTTATFIFSTPTLSVSGASSAASLTLPELVMTTTDFAELGVAADNRTIWDILRQNIVDTTSAVMDGALQAIAWAADKIEGAYNYVKENPMVLVDGLQVVLDVAGFVPFFGIVPDAINTVIHVARGNWVDAGMSAVAIIPFYGDAIKGAYNAGKAAVKGASAAKGAMKAAKGATEVLTHLDEVRDVGKAAAGAADEVADAAKAASDVPNPHCKPDSANCFVAGTKVLMRMREDGDLELLDELAATGTMTAETDETAMMAVTALALGVGFAVARDKVNGKERLKKRPRRRKDVRPGSTDGDEPETINVDEPTAHNAGVMVLSDGGSTDKQSLHEPLTSGRIWVSGALTSLMLICFAVSGWLWTQTPRENQAQAVAAELVQHRTVAVNETENIEDVRLGRRVVGRNPLREQTQSPSNIHPETHRTIRLEMIQHGTIFELAFLRSLTWLDEQQAQVGGMIHLEMLEMGLDGPARVVSIDPCPEIEPDDGTGRMVVTGTMKHLAGNVLEIQTEGDAEPLGVTDTHPIWSVDRQDFVVAGQLTVGELLEQADGTVTQITRITPTRGPPVMVYNLEIDAEHVFRVGEDGLLVHNVCPWEVDTYDALKKNSKPFDDIDIHHAGQQHAMAQLIPGYNSKLAPSIAVPSRLHRQIPTVSGTVSRTVRGQLAKDIRDLRAIGAPNSALKKLIELNKDLYPGVF